MSFRGKPVGNLLTYGVSVGDYDSPWKEALEQYFQAFCEFYFPVVHAGVPWERGYEFLDKELQQVVRDADT